MLHEGGGSYMIFWGAMGGWGAGSLDGVMLPLRWVRK